MGYSEYGGYGYRNGDRIKAASDAVVTPDMANAGTPGHWPGFGPVADDMGMQAFYALKERSVDGHVVIGDGPVLVALHKLTTMTVHVLENGAFTEIDLIAIGQDLPDDIVSDHGDGSLHLDRDALELLADPLRFMIDGHLIEYRIARDPQIVQHVRLTQPDGTVWSAFCGSEIGEGHDEADTAPIVEKHRRIFPSGKAADA
jgi:hypothetical protein